MRASPVMLLLAILGCHKVEPPAPAETPPPASPAQAPAAPPATPVAPALVAAARRGPAPTSGCAVDDEQTIGSDVLRSLALPSVQPMVLLVHARSFSLWQLRGDGWVEGPSLHLEAEPSRVGAACDGTTCDIGWVDARARLLGVHLDQRGFAAPRELTRGVDRRFAPAIAHVGKRVLYAFTSTVDEVMHTQLLTVEGMEVGAPRDLTPPSHGAAAPTFVLGGPLTLVAIDAHAGISPLLEVPFDGATPKSALIRTPVSQPFEPPLIAAVQLPSGEVEVAFTAVGKLAMSAVGRVPLRRAAEVTALSPSRGYGELSFALARSDVRALYAFEVPIASTPKADRKLELLLGDGRTSEPGPSFDAPALHPSLARGTLRGEYVLTFTRTGSAQALTLRCVD